MTTILGELYRRTDPLGWTTESIDGALYHYRLTSPGGERVIEVEITPGPEPRTTVEGWVGRWPISMTFNGDFPVELIVRQLEDWGALPAEVAVPR